MSRNIKTKNKDWNERIWRRNVKQKIFIIEKVKKYIEEKSKVINYINDILLQGFDEKFST